MCFDLFGTLALVTVRRGGDGILSSPVKILPRNHNIGVRWERGPATQSNWGITGVYVDSFG